MATSAQPGSTPVVLESRTGAVALITLNRPEKLNAINVELTSALLAALSRAAEDATVRAIVLTGAGRAFCAGGDITLMREARTSSNAGRELEAMLRAGKDVTLALVDLPKPVVAAVNGPAAGAGMNIALACDLRIAVDSATFGQNFVKIGLFPDYGGTYFLPRLVGATVAAEMFYTGEMISAAEALRLGIVNRVTTAPNFEAEVRNMAARLAQAAPVSLQASKRALFGQHRDELVRALDFEIENQVKCFVSEDHLEGVTAFLEKRKPVFKGR